MEPGEDPYACQVHPGRYDRTPTLEALVVRQDPQDPLGFAGKTSESALQSHRAIGEGPNDWMVVLAGVAGTGQLLTCLPGPRHQRTYTRTGRHNQRPHSDDNRSWIRCECECEATHCFRPMNSTEQGKSFSSTGNHYWLESGQILGWL